MGSLI